MHEIRLQTVTWCADGPKVFGAVGSWQFNSVITRDALDDPAKFAEWLPGYCQWRYGVTEVSVNTPPAETWAAMVEKAVTRGSEETSSAGGSMYVSR